MIKNKAHVGFRQGMRIACKILSSFFILYTIVGFIVIPVVLKHYLPGGLTAAIKRSVTIKYVRFNPFALSITIGNFKISGAKGEDFVSIDRLYGNLELSSLWHGGPVVKLIEIRKPSVHIIKNGDGSFNYSDMLVKKTGESSSPTASRPKDETPGLLFKLCRISVKGADIRFMDKASSFSAVVTPLDINLTGLTNAPDQMAGFEVSGKTDFNESFQCTGTLVPKPFSISGNLNLRRIDLSRYAPLYSRYVDYIIKDGKVDVSTSFAFPEKKSRAGKGYFVDGATVTLSSFELADSSKGGTILNLPKFEISGLLFSLDRKIVHIQEVTTADAAINIERSADGCLNISRHSGDDTDPEVKKTQAAVPDSGGNQASPAWAVDIDKISLDHYAIRFVDNVSVKQVLLVISPIDINGISFSNRPGSSGDVFFSFKTGKGIVAARGKVSLSPLNVDLDIKADDIGITPVCPYVSEKVKIDINSGSISGFGHVSVRSGPKGISGGFTGGAALSDFSASDRPGGDEFVKWTRLAFSDISLIFRPFSVSMGNISLQAPDLKIVRLPGGALNLVNAFRPPELQEKKAVELKRDKPSGSQQSGNPATEAVLVNIHSIDVKKGNVVFEDQEISPAFACKVSEMNLRLNNLLFPGAHKTDFTFSGKFEDQAMLHVSGDLFPLDLNDDTRVNFDFSNIGIPVFTPYFGHYLGYELKKGKLFLKLGYSIKKNWMAGENHVLFDKLYLGDSVKSHAAVYLPLKIALALLRDRNEKITLDVPVKGDVENPEFRFGKAIYTAFVNLISKIATSPFTALGSMFNDSDKLGFVSFAPGTDELIKNQTEKIRKLVYALYERPALQLIINPLADPVGDRQALVDREFLQRIQSEKKKKRAIKGKPAAVDDKISIPVKLRGKEYQAYLRSACKNAGIEVSGVSPKMLELRLKSLIVIPDQELLDLAQKRGAAVRDAIRDEKKIKMTRVFLTTPIMGSKPGVGFKLKAE